MATKIHQLAIDVKNDEYSSSYASMIGLHLRVLENQFRRTIEGEILPLENKPI